MSLKLFILATVLTMAAGHGYLKEPISRTSVFMRDDINTEYNPPYWWDHQGVWCGNVEQDTRYSTCGRCGDAPGETTANQDGIYDKKKIAATYQAGQMVEVEVEFGALHYGHMEFELCPQVTESNNCFTKLPIVSAILDGSNAEVRDGNRVCLPMDGTTTRIAKANIWLPAGVRCERCTLRWTYRTSYPGPIDWDRCDNPRPTQTFRNCADVKIV